ncbi:MAG: aminoglycoside phosphotransferase family protein [Muribaculaceae bacterium]|nr:aminoglycoside phosphotransferase family protein [Muribaculaceae bacterium]
MGKSNLASILSHFQIEGQVIDIKPLGNGLINDTYHVVTQADTSPDFVLQRINNAIFQDVDLLQHNIEVVTAHLRRKLEGMGVEDIDRRVLQFVKSDEGKTYYHDQDGGYWRVMMFIPDSFTHEAVTPESALDAGRAFGNFECMLVDVPEQLGETIPDFHNMELRMRQLAEAVKDDKAGRLHQVQDIVAMLERDANEMCQAEQLYREGKLPKRICHCDTKVNNMLFDSEGQVLCVIDLDTVMPSFIFSDYGDFLRTGANFTAEDDPDLSHVGFNEAIFKSFTMGYLEATHSFLTPLEIKLLPFAVALFPFMQCTRFLTDYINGDTYYKIKYDTHNLDRARNQLALYHDVRKHYAAMESFILEALGEQHST